jgi:hypothetical protein
MSTRLMVTSLVLAAGLALHAPGATRTPLAFGDPVRTLALDPGERDASASLVDLAAGFAYFAFSGNPAFSPAELVKIRLSDFTRVGTLVLAPGEDTIDSAVIDAAGGCAYFGTDSTPGAIVKIRLSDFSRVGSLTLNPGENRLSPAVIDPGSGFAYFGTQTIPASLVKVRLSDFTRAGALPMDPAGTGAIDASGGFAYFTTSDLLVKLRLSDFSWVGSMRPFFLSDPVSTSVIEPGGAYAYLGGVEIGPIGGSFNWIVKVRLSDLTWVGYLITNSGGGSAVNFSASSIDPTGQYALFVTFGGSVERIRLSDFTLVDSLDLAYRTTSAVLDPGSGNLFVSATGQTALGNYAGKVVKVRVSDMTRVDALSLRMGEDVRSSVIDTVAGFAYFGTYTEPGVVVKVRLSDFTRVGTLTLDPGEGGLTSAVIDPVAGFAYFGTNTDPGIVVKVRLSDFTRVSATTLNVAESYLRTAAIDAAAGFAYFGTDPQGFIPLPGGQTNSHGLLVKVRLSDLTRVGSLDVTGVPGSVFSSVIDPLAGYAYLGTGTAAAGPGAVVKVRLSDFTSAGALPLPDIHIPSSAVIEPAGGSAYFGSYDERPGVVARVRLSDFMRDGTLSLLPGESYVQSAVIDPAAGFAYFGALSSPSGLVSREVAVKVRLSDMTSLGEADLGMISSVSSAVIDPVAGFAYFAGASMGFGDYARGWSIARLDLSAGGAATGTVTGGEVFCPSYATRPPIQVYLTGAPPWSLVWSDGVTQTGLLTSPASRFVSPAATTTYALTSVSDANGAGIASGSATFAIKTVPPVPTITAPAAAFPRTTGLTASVPYHPGNGYSWIIAGGDPTSFRTSNRITFTGSSAGKTTLWVSEVQDGCYSGTAKATVAVATATPALNLYTLPPCRVFDTRSSSGPALAAGSDRIFDTTGQCAIPSTATALSVNVAVTEPASSGNLSLHAGNEPVSPTATINFSTGHTRANNAIVRLASDGSGTLGVQSNSAGAVHFILDVNGYFQ